MPVRQISRLKCGIIYPLRKKQMRVKRTSRAYAKGRMILMIEWKQMRENPHIRRSGKLLLCMLSACLLSLARFGGLALPLNAALAAALSPAGGIAVLAGGAAADFLTGTLQKQPILICAPALVTMIRWLLNIRQTPRAAALLAGCSTGASAAIFAIARLTGSREWIIWLIYSFLNAGLACCIRQVILRIKTDLPIRLHEGDTLAFSVCTVIGLTTLCSLRMFRISFGIMLTAALILTAAKRYRITGGVICGMLSAVAIVLADGKAAPYAVMLPAAGFAAGLLSGKSSAVSYLVFQFIGAAGLILVQWESAVANAMVSGIIGGLIFLLLPTVPAADSIMQWSDSDADLAALTEARLEFLSHSIAGVRGNAERIANVMSGSSPAADQFRTVCDTVCSRCRSRALCWEHDDREARNCFRQLSEADLSEKLKAPFGCVQPDQVTAAFSRTKRQNAAAKVLAARLRESQKLLFSQMRITEELLHGAGKQSRRTYHRELTRYVSDVLAKYGIPVLAAAVSTGEHHRMLIELYAPAEEKLDPELISECLCDALQRPVSCCGTEKAGGEQRMILQTAGGYSVQTAAAQCAVHEDEPCGDCWDTFSDHEGAFYLAVSDGMGSGRHAAVDARIVLSNFRQLVQSGMDCKAAARMINAIMLTKSGEERFATLDVAKICTDTGAVTLYKYGAGPTFVKHGSQITLCQAATNPIGILPIAEPYTTVLKLERGDMLFLLTDGLDDTLFPYVRQKLKQGGDLQTLAHAFCAKAQRESKGAPQDDVTVLAASLTAAAVDE